MWLIYSSYINPISCNSTLHCSGLCDGCLNPCHTTCLTIMSCACDVPQIRSNLSVVGQCLQQSGDPVAIWINSGSLFVSKSSVMTLLCILDVALIISDEHDNDVTIVNWRTFHLFVNKPNDISIQICIWVRKQLYASLLGFWWLDPVNGTSIWWDIVYAASPILYKPSGNWDMIGWSEVFFKAAWSDYFPGAATEKNMKCIYTSQTAWIFKP